MTVFGIDLGRSRACIAWLPAGAGAPGSAAIPVTNSERSRSKTTTPGLSRPKISGRCMAWNAASTSRMKCSWIRSYGRSSAAPRTRSHIASAPVLEVKMTSVCEK